MGIEDDTPTMAWLFFSPSGRIGRWPYLMANLFWLVVPGIAVAQMFAHQDDNTALALWTLALIVIALVSLVSLLMLSVKRVHDMGFTGFLVLLLFVPMVSFVAMATFLFWPSAPPNAYGEHTNRPE